MTPRQTEFADKYHGKIVRPHILGPGAMPQKNYLVTAALLEWEDDLTILAIMALDYTPENAHWFTLKIAPDELDYTLENLEIIRPATDEEIASRLMPLDSLSEGERDEMGLNKFRENLEG